MQKTGKKTDQKLENTKLGKTCGKWKINFESCGKPEKLKTCRSKRFSAFQQCFCIEKQTIKSEMLALLCNKSMIFTNINTITWLKILPLAVL